MIELKEKQEIILMHIRDGKSQREISRITGRDRKTVRKYIKEYDEKRRKLIESKGENAEEIINAIVEKPRYDTSGRKKKKLTQEIMDRINFHLKENEKKVLQGLHKQKKKKIDIYESLVKEGFDIGYTTVCQTISKILDESKEAFIRGTHKPGDVCEFDWGKVKLWIDSVFMKLSMAAFCTADGNYRYGNLYVNEKNESFMESHVGYFSHIKGNHNIIVYDNMKTAVKKFVGVNEKEPTEDLVKLSMYYGFQFRFCNVYCANEKGRVERTVEYLRRKAFSDMLEFSSIEEANKHLHKICEELNNKPQKAMDNKTAAEKLEEERPYLMPVLPPFDCAVVKNYRVNKYSVVNIDSCFYSVPDKFVNKIILAKVYTDKVILFSDELKIAEHKKLLGFGKWSLDINHYLKTLKKKPGAIPDSLALQQANSKIKNIYEKYYTTKNREFVELLLFINECEIPIQQIEIAIKKILSTTPTDVTTEKIKVLCTNQNEADNRTNREDSIHEFSKNMLSMYGCLLNTTSENMME